MQKVSLIVHVSDVDQALDIVQRSGAIEFRAADVERRADMTTPFPNADLLPRVMHAVQFLEPYAPKKGLWRSLRDGTTTDLTEQEVAKRLSETDAIVSVVGDLELIQVEFADINERLDLLTQKHAVLREWYALPFRLSQLETAQTQTLLFKDDQCTTNTPLAASVRTQLETFRLTAELTEIDAQKVAVTVLKNTDESESFAAAIEADGAEIVTLPQGVETPEIEIVAVAEELAEVKGRLAVQHDQAEHFALTYLETLRVAGEVLAWQRDRFAVTDEAGSTANTLVFEGWLNDTKREAIESRFQSHKLAAAFANIEPAEGEEAPVDIQNSPFLQPFEAVTRLYGMPGYTDLDPTVFLAGFFFLFFGLSLTDVGYGVTLMAVSAMILTLFKVSDAVRMFAKLLLFVGFATVLVGLLFGGYLGVDPSSLPPALQALQMFDPIANPLPVFYLALGLGVFQVMVGLLLKIYSESRNDRLVDGILDQGPWLFLFTLGILYLANALGYADIFTAQQIINLVYVGLVLVVLTSGRHGKGVFGKVAAAASSLYASIGFFSDILSYSRLLALGLATTALAFAVNLIAEIVSDSVPYLGPVLALIILVIGHAFTLAVNTLGAFIHSARLQFVEFFGKFIAGTGKEFSPLSRSQKYVSIRDD